MTSPDNPRASAWSITLSCGCTYRLPSGPPDLKSPYICGVHQQLKMVDMAVRNKQEEDS